MKGIANRLPGNGLELAPPKIVLSVVAETMFTKALNPIHLNLEYELSRVNFF